ncbi:MAG: T9SS type A sorting domain-containing protein [bacterium]|nr:T9SS type A sorting domain-containing protein [bacterium]
MGSVPQNSGTTQNLNKVQFVDANTGWAVGDSGTILYTTNSGVDWVQQTSGINLNLVDISFVDANTGWVVGENFILKTTNGGISWSQQIHDSLYFNAVFFIDENIGWLCSDGIILKTTDGGNIWIPKPIGGGDIQFLDPIKGFLASSSIYKSTDGGDNWIESLWGGMTGHFDRISFSDSENGFVIHHYSGGFGQNFFIERTTNGGADWITTNYPWAQCRDVHSINSNIVYVVGIGSQAPVRGAILKTSDGGTTWNEQFFELDKTLNGVHFVNENIGWVVGDSGTVLHTTNGGVTFIDNEPTQPTEFILEQNFPNPFNPSTVISYQLPVSSDVTLKVFDVLGNEIATLVNEYIPAGRYEVEFNAASLTSGVYFYQLRTEDYIAVKKMILLK